MGFVHILVYSVQGDEGETLFSLTDRASESLKCISRAQKPSNHKFE